ncbi:hypothetical protein GPY51_22590 [Photorhabdus laumondii subsp. laumondii]|uniref:Uncharacterized protein n=1 Tax=Photorhabdus laumondii subsp. laumondii TaxID=141679 RepID=A0A6L9JUI2_PHOLM|nr:MULTISPECIES: hypothetical protein [Photorhabdus]MCC8386154.1 hypothetical protein [Photorhabdus laumondii]MCC8388832.1 hypothetical protein [Photorhabdus laumondii]MCC8415301.1 hypothetical protein [Photorhabdus laumondii]MCZ1250617.1 hypothetical protein [Photorhabdus laumondii subsp. laumondii]NDK97146.1 hypothetical protein [Photorhabdus laumondii subsp. laumondii]
MTNKERFEKWLIETYPWGEGELEKAFFQEEHQYYISRSNALHFAWAGWKARSEVRVELPNYIDCDDECIAIAETQADAELRFKLEKIE